MTQSIVLGPPIATAALAVAAPRPAEEHAPALGPAAVAPPARPVGPTPPPSRAAPSALAPAATLRPPAAAAASGVGPARPPADTDLPRLPPSAAFFRGRVRVPHPCGIDRENVLRGRVLVASQHLADACLGAALVATLPASGFWLGPAVLILALQQRTGDDGHNADHPFAPSLGGLGSRLAVALVLVGATALGLSAAIPAMLGTGVASAALAGLSFALPIESCTGLPGAALGAAVGLGLCLGLAALAPTGWAMAAAYRSLLPLAAIVPSLTHLGHRQRFAADEF